MRYMYGMKDDFIPKTKVELARRERYEAALALRQVVSPDMRLSDWVREACDAQAKKDLG